MYPVDIVIMVLIAISVLMGVFRGLVREVFSLLGWFAAYIVAQLFHEPLEILLASTISTPSVRLVVAWGGLFLSTLLLCMVMAWLISSLMDAAGVRGIDRLFGAVFGLLRGVIAVLAALVMMAPFVSSDAWWRDAKLPQEFMRYEQLGHTLRRAVVTAAKEAGAREPSVDDIREWAQPLTQDK